MSLQAIYPALGLLAFLAEAGLLVVLLVRRQYRLFPVFTIYIAFNLFVDIGVGTLIAVSPPRIGQSVALATLPIQYLLELGVLFEIAQHVLRPSPAAVHRSTLRWYGGLAAVAVLGGIFLAWHLQGVGKKLEDIRAPLDLTVGLLRMLIFGATAGFAQVLGLGWKNKVLQLATALSFYSAADLIVSLGERNVQLTHTLEPVRGLAYLCELGFLVWVFTTKEVRRRDFSPQMEQFLVTLAGRARLARTALVRMQVK